MCHVMKKPVLADVGIGKTHTGLLNYRIETSLSLEILGLRPIVIILSRQRI